MMHPFAFVPSSNLSPLVESAFRGLLLAALVAGGLKLLRVRNVITQKATWILTLAAAFAMPLLLPFALRVPIPDSIAAHLYLHRRQQITATTWSTPIAPTVTVVRSEKFVRPVTDDEIAGPSTPQVPSDGDGFGNSGTGGSQSIVPAARGSAPLLTRGQFLFLLYCGVGLTLLFRLLRGMVVAHRLWRTADPVDEERVAQFAESLPVRSSSRVASPLNIHSGILLPADYPEWEDEKLAVVLAHEASHVRQRDFYLQLAAQLYAAIFWFSPLGWWMGRKLSDLSEAISDCAGLESAPSPAAYAQVLLEFAALARPNLTGVAMARPGRLTQRIERVLNESSFRQAFTASRLRLGAALLLIPAAVFAATAMVRVDAAQVTPPPAVAPPADVPQQPSVPAAIPPKAAAPGIPQAAAPAQPAQLADPAPPAITGPIHVEIPPVPPISPDVQALIRAQSDTIQAKALLAMKSSTLINAKVQAELARAMAEDGPLGYWLGSNQDPYVIVRRADSGGTTVHVPKTRTWHNMSGDTMEEYKAEIDKAKQVAHGDFLWFRRDGKSYVIDDPAVLAQINPMQDKIDALGKQQQALGKQQEALGKQQEELGRQMEQVKVPTPDMQRELTKLQAVQAKLAALQGKDATQEQLSEIQSELAAVQGRIGAIQSNMGGRMGDLGGKMGALGGQQGKLGAEQGRLGAQQGRLARELDGKVLGLIDESLKDGKAKPVN